MPSPIDVGILTIIPSEIEALFTTLGIDKQAHLEVRGPLHYWRATTVSRVDHKVLSLAVSFISGTAGNIESAISTTLMLELLKPRLMCLVGIAAGAAGKSRIGDVVVPDVVHDVTVTVRKDDTTQPRRRSYEIDGRLMRLLKLEPLDSEILRNVLLLAEPEHEKLVAIAEKIGLDRADIAHPPSIKDGSLVSGNTLLRDSRYFPDFHSSSDERCRAAEMEGAGFARACVVWGCPWIVIRGISDFGDQRKDDSFHKYAANNACVALREFLQAHWRVGEFPHTRADEEALLTGTLEQSLSDEYRRKNYNYVVEIGRFLSRPLWLSGKLEMRRKIGELVEDSAANCGRDLDRARALTDDIGWTNVVLGDLPQARKAIRDGLRLSMEIKDWYLCAKACRHLASICRQKGEMKECGRLLSEADAFAKRIEDEGDRSEMAISLVVSRAKMLLADAKPQESITLLKDARTKYHASGDALREVKVFHPLGRARLALKDSKGAIEAFTEGYEFAMSCGRKNEALANVVELALVVADSGDKDGAMKWATQAVRLSVDLSDYSLPPRVLSLVGRMEDLSGGP